MSTPTARRVRTEEQLARKRHADRLSHKARRDKDKNRISRLVADVDNLRSELGALRTELQALKSATHTPLASMNPSISSPSSPSSPLWRPISPLLARCVESVEPDADQDAALLLVSADTSSPAAISATPQSIAPLSRWPLLVFCMCGSEHQSKLECPEYASYSILLKAQMALLNGTPAFAHLPRTPNLSHLLLQRTDDNPVITIMATVFRCLNIPSIPVQFGLYILIYRLLRWRLYLDPQSYQDIPPWYRSSTLQETVPHTISIDYLPWPLLRDYLVTNNLMIIGSAHSVLLYTQAFRFAWPDGKDLVIKSPRGDMVLNPEFESYVVSLENWKISRSWAESYPELVHLVNVEEDITES